MENLSCCLNATYISRNSLKSNSQYHHRSVTGPPDINGFAESLFAMMSNPNNIYYSHNIPSGIILPNRFDSASNNGSSNAFGNAIIQRSYRRSAFENEDSDMSLDSEDEDFFDCDSELEKANIEVKAFLKLTPPNGSAKNYYTPLEEWGTENAIRNLQNSRKAKRKCILDLLFVGRGHMKLNDLYRKSVLDASFGSAVISSRNDDGGLEKEFAENPKEVLRSTYREILSSLMENPSARENEVKAGRPSTGSNCQKIFYCKNFCMAYTGQFRDEQQCKFCSTPRKSNYYFNYYSIRTFLRYLINDPELAAILFRNKESPASQEISDFWTSQNYLILKQRTNYHSIPENTSAQSKYFSTEREIAVSLGVAMSELEYCAVPGEHMTFTLTILNLPQPLCRLSEFVFIPYVFLKTPKNYKGRPAEDYSTFLTPLIEDFAEMSKGFPAFDGRTKQIETVRAHLVQICGEMPGLSFISSFEAPSKNSLSQRNTGLPLMSSDETRNKRGYPGDDLREGPDRIRRQRLNYRCPFEGSLGSIFTPDCLVLDSIPTCCQNLIHPFTYVLAAKHPSSIVKYFNKQALKLRGLIPGCGQFTSNIFSAKPNMGPIAWKALSSAFGFFRTAYNLNDTLLHQPYVLRYTATPEQDLIDLITEMTAILRLMELSSLPRESLDHFKVALTSLHSDLRRIIGPDDQILLSRFDAAIRSMLGLFETIERVGMPRVSFASNVKEAVDSLGLLTKGKRYSTVALSNRLCLRFANQVLYPAKGRFKVETGADFRFSDRDLRFDSILDGTREMVRYMIQKKLSDDGLQDISTSDDNILLSSHISVTVDGKHSRETFREESLVKFYAPNGAPDYGILKQIYNIGFRDHPHVTYPIVVLEVVPKFPLIMRSKLLYPGEMPYVTYGYLRVLNPTQQPFLHVADATSLASRCYSIPMSNIQNELSKKYHYIYDSNPAFGHEVIRRSIDFEIGLYNE